MRGAEPLKKINLERDLVLFSQYDNQFVAVNREKCLTGLAQWSLVCLALHAQTGDEGYLDCAIVSLFYVLSKQIQGDGDLRGAPGLVTAGGRQPATLGRVKRVVRRDEPGDIGVVIRPGHRIYDDQHDWGDERNMSHLDPTLSAILSELYAVSAERDRYRAMLDEVKATADGLAERLAQYGESAMTMTSGVMDGRALAGALGTETGDPSAYLRSFGYGPPPLADRAVGALPIDVEVNHGQWIWRCPCGLGGIGDPPSGGGVAFVDQPFGWCPRCENVATDGRWRSLRFPPEREAIERALAVRPDPDTRNWSPGETIEQLLAENAEHGIGLTDRARTEQSP
jgi:hypothetical protein